MSTLEKSWEPGYEWKAVTLLSIGFGLVGIDRFMIMPLFPLMMKEWHFDYQDLGYITGALAIAWGISSIFMGSLSDRIGHRKVIIPALVLFSLLCGASGFAASVGTLILIRALMGLFEGAYTPVSIIATIDASRPSRHGRNVGIQQMMMPLLGLGVAPVLVTQLLKVLPWHWVFALGAIPGLIVAFLLYRVLRDSDAKVAALHTATHDASSHRWFDVFRYWNIPLNIVGMFCWVTNLVILPAFLPGYLTEILRLNIQQMGFVMSAIGLGAAAGAVLMPALSDKLGRKSVMIISVSCSLIALGLLMRCGAHSPQLFACLFMTMFGIFALITLTVGPISAESVPAALMTTASGLVIGVGEVFGGGVAPALAGYVAKHYGVENAMYFALGALVVGLVVAISLKETAPGRKSQLVSGQIGTPIIK
ncbi:MFS transporter [Burkholderia multivorans]|uniref:MFS transporter n=1 Tax=Burkholderia multivorans TaxID=87883 RepID=UPI00084223A1|nr:MFS transporter [Burkholderia multivorans]AOJ94834.1 MFS transporter permease [Burkholderia multivorans]MCA8456823.1 MFS transporter [Burkholderia multivorans]